MAEVKEAILALLAGRGNRSWLTGAAARHALGKGERPARWELITDAEPETCAETLQLAGEVVQSADVELTPLAGRDLEDVLGERGITVDAIAVAPDGETIDPFDGLCHLETGALRTIAPPDRAFREQPLLLFGVPRVIAWTGLAGTSDLRRFASRDAGNLLDAQDRRHRWGREVNHLLLGSHIERALDWMEQTRVLAFTMPEIAAMVGFDKSCQVHHKDIWEHTRLVTQKAAQDLVVRWAALCHDIGKVWTRTVNRSGKVHFFRHEDHGALLFESIAHRFALSDELTERVSYLIRNHSRVNLYRHDWTDSAVRRLIRETEHHLQDLLTFSRADFTTRREWRIEEMRRLMDDLEERIARIRAEDAKQPPLGKGIGNAIMERFGLAPSRAIGDLKRRLEGVIEEGALPERADDAVYLDWLAQDADATQLIESAGGRV